MTSNAFGLSDDQREILEQVDRFARAELHPLQQRMDDDEWWPPQTFGLFGDNGYLSVMAPPELGGAGLDFFASGLVVQAVTRWNPSIALGILVHENLCMYNILANAPEDLLRRYVPGMCTGEIVGALGLTEPGAGSDALGGMRTTARRDGKGYVLNGTKLFITNAQLPISYWSTRRPMRTLAPMEFPPSRWRRARPDSRWPRNWSRWACGAVRRRSSSSMTATSRPRTWSVRRIEASPC
jgi:hypothetical protein